jgi:hypothetical protein
MVVWLKQGPPEMLGKIQPEEMCDGDKKMVKMVDGQPATPEDAVDASSLGMLDGINKGDLSNAIALGFLILGIATVAVDAENTFFAYLLSFGLFSFCGGITNWLAIKVSSFRKTLASTLLFPS